MAVLQSTSTVWVVVDDASEVVVMCSGADAAEHAAEWADRGYRVLAVDPADVNAA